MTATASLTRRDPLTHDADEALAGALLADLVREQLGETPIGTTNRP